MATCLDPVTCDGLFLFRAWERSDSQVVMSIGILFPVDSELALSPTDAKGYRVQTWRSVSELFLSYFFLLLLSSGSGVMANGSIGVCCGVGQLELGG